MKRVARVAAALGLLPAPAWANAVFVLHCFKKKSTKGNETPKPDMDLIRKRLDDAKRLAEGEWK